MSIVGWKVVGVAKVIGPEELGQVIADADVSTVAAVDRRSLTLWLNDPSPETVEAVEIAAERNGIELERVVP